MRVERVPFPASISRKSQPTPISERGGCFAAGGRKGAHARDFGGLLARAEIGHAATAAQQRDEIAAGWSFDHLIGERLREVGRGFF
jgi:hypothetical protein